VSDRTGGKSGESGTLPIRTNTVEKRGPVRDKTHANIMLGARLGSFQINFQFCWPSPKGLLSTWYIFETIGAYAIFLYWRRDPQLSNCLQRPPVQGKKACTRPNSTPLHTAKCPMQYRNDICILDRGAPLHAPCVGLHCAHNAPGCHSMAPTLLRHRVRRSLSGAWWGHVELAGHPTIKKRNAAPTNGDLSRFPCRLS